MIEILWNVKHSAPLRNFLFMGAICREHVVIDDASDTMRITTKGMNTAVDLIS